MRSNLRSVKVGDNLPLMEKFYKNMQSIFSMLSALPCAIPPLPSQYRIKDDFIRHLSSTAIDEAAAWQIRNTYPTYSKVPEFVQNIRKLPFGNFVSFPAEMIRTTYLHMMERKQRDASEKSHTSTYNISNLIMT